MPAHLSCTGGTNDRKAISTLKTVGVKLTRNQGIHLARVLLAVTQDWEEIDITAWRTERRHSDGTYRLTITSAVDRAVDLG